MFIFIIIGFNDIVSIGQWQITFECCFAIGKLKSRRFAYRKCGVLPLGQLELRGIYYARGRVTAHKVCVTLGEVW